MCRNRLYWWFPEVIPVQNHSSKWTSTARPSSRHVTLLKSPVRLARLLPCVCWRKSGCEEVGARTQELGFRQQIWRGDDRQWVDWGGGGENERGQVASGAIQLPSERRWIFSHFSKKIKTCTPPSFPPMVHWSRQDWSRPASSSASPSPLNPALWNYYWVNAIQRLAANTGTFLSFPVTISTSTPHTFVLLLVFGGLMPRSYSEFDKTVKNTWIITHAQAAHMITKKQKMQFEWSQWSSTRYRPLLVPDVKIR